MSNSILARPLITAIATTALTTGILTGVGYAHGTGEHTGGAGMGTATVTATKTMDHNRWRYLDFVGPGYSGQSYSCFYKHTGRGLARICPELN